MAGVFISYRRIESGWAGRLFDHLAARFGKAVVFMDVEGGIPRGADFPEAIAEAIGGCEAMLVLIGPAWLHCTRKDGRRRLDVEEDWVRREVAGSLARGIPVVPVLLGGAALPCKEELPEELHGLVTRNQAVVRDEAWLDGVNAIGIDLERLTTLRALDAVVAAGDGLRLLRHLIQRVPAIAEAVGRSRQILDDTDGQLHRLQVHKELHDQLHVIEFECLQPLQASLGTAKPHSLRRTFGAARKAMHALLDDERAACDLADEIRNLLEPPMAAFQDAIDGGDPSARERIVSSLQELLSSLPSKLDLRISLAAGALRLDQLAQLLDVVRQQLPPRVGPELDPLVQGIDAVGRLRRELEGRVKEHGQLQALDSELRTPCTVGLSAGSVPAVWKSVRRARSRLPPNPVTPELADATGDLAAAEAEIETALRSGPPGTAQEMVYEYFRVVATVFRDVDASLRDLCRRLGEVGMPLRLVLDQSKVTDGARSGS